MLVGAAYNINDKLVMWHQSEHFDHQDYSFITIIDIPVYTKFTRKDKIRVIRWIRSKSCQIKLQTAAKFSQAAKAMDIMTYTGILFLQLQDVHHTN